jgi:hypothetical protein
VAGAQSAVIGELCSYCGRPSAATIYLRNGPLRALLRRPRRARRVCTDHIHRADRPGGLRA